MYLHFDISQIDLKRNFPEEFGSVIPSFSSDKLETVYFDLNNSSLIDFDSVTGKLNSINKVNFFIGPNNSGKSRFLRGLYKINSTLSERDLSASEIIKKIEESSFFDLNQTPVPNKELVDICKSLNNLFLNPQNIDGIKTRLDNTKLKQTTLINFKELAGTAVSERSSNQLEVVELIEEFLKQLKFKNKNDSKAKVYIPTLRSLLVDNSLQKTSYESVIENKYKIKNCYTGLNLYDKIYTLHNSTRIGELDRFYNWIRTNFYSENKFIRLIPNLETQNLSIEIDNELRSIYDTGDGIQQLILLMFPIYTATHNTWFFIEEPETHLHPGLQRIFLETLINDEHIKGKNLKFFFTTHSNHFLDISINHNEISIFQLEKVTNEKFNIKTDIKPNRETLNLLGVNSSSVFLANVSIWVEGPTDRKYISKWLRLYAEHNSLPLLKEDIDFAFFEYGGNLIEHYLFDENFEEEITESQVREKIRSFSLSSKIYLLVDNDSPKENSAKHDRHKALEDLSNNNFYYQNTIYKEIENLLPPKILQQSLEIFTKNNSIPQNIEIIREDYKNVGIGLYLEELLKKEGIETRKFKSKTGETLNTAYKNQLCDFVINQDFTYQDFIYENEHLDNIIMPLYNFITAK